MNTLDFEKYLITSQFLARIERLSHALKNPDGVWSPLYVVGGTVRDAYLRRGSADIDLASPLLPVELAKRLEMSGLRVLPTGLKHQTVTVLWEDGSTAEITTFRKQGITSKEGVVQGDTIEEDLRLRDFTINALAYGVHDQRIIDPCQGICDLNNGVLRGVEDPEQRFKEDPLRILRMVRLACTLNFGIDTETYAAAIRVVPMLRETSAERIREEFNRIVMSSLPGLGLRLLADLGVVASHFPELAVCVGFEQNRFHKADVFEHTLEVVENVEADLTLRLAALFHDIGKPPTMTLDEVDGDRHFFKHEVVGAELTEQLMSRLRYSNEMIRDVSELVRLHMRPTEAGAGGLRRLLRDTGELFERWRALKDADARACRLPGEHVDALMEKFDLAMAEIRHGPAVSPLASLAVKGRDLLKSGYKAGPAIGIILRALHERVLDDPSLNEKSTLLALVPEIHAAIRAPEEMSSDIAS